MKNVNKNEIITARCRQAKKFTAILTVAFMTMIMASCFAMSAFAADVNVSTSSFISTACKVLKALIILIGGGIAVWGVANLIEGYGSDNPGSKSQGMKQFMAGIALIILALALVPELEAMMGSAVQ